MERESERRAKAETVARTQSVEDDASEMVSASDTLKAAKHRRRGSVSITRFGQVRTRSTTASSSTYNIFSTTVLQLSDDSSQKVSSGTTSPTPTGISSIASQSAFYRAQSQVRICSGPCHVPLPHPTKFPFPPDLRISNISHLTCLAFF